jgi:hypothetical protein
VRGWLVCNEGDNGEGRADEAEEQYSPFSHTESMRREEADERAD